MFNKVYITGLNTNNLKSLSQKETKELFIKLKNGDLKAKEELIMGNLKLVLSILKKFSSYDYNNDDLFQVGMIGLIKAIDNFDISLDLCLSTYASLLIIGEIKRYIRDNKDIRISRSVRDLSYKIMAYQEDFYNKNGHNPTGKEIAKHFNISEYQVMNCLDSLKPIKSLSEVIYEDKGDSIYLEEQIGDKSFKKTNQDDIIALNEAMQKLNENEKNILLERYIYGLTQSQIASAMQVSQAQVSRLEKSSIEKVRKLIK